MLALPLAPMAAWPQFVAWSIEDGRKLPYSAITGRLASTTNPADWSTYEIARAYADSAGMAGVGFVFTAADPFFFLDVDKALSNGQWSQVAQEICALMAGAAVEVSQSGAGLHIFGRYSVQPIHRNKNTALGLELYTQERFVALTGTGAMGDAGALMDGPLVAAVAKWFAPVTSDRSDTWTTEAVPEWSGPEDDDELLAIAMRSTPGRQVTAASAFGAEPTTTDDGPTFAQLWAADADALARKWPGNSGAYDASSADQSLANMLAFWTGKNCERIDRMMRRSALARVKWDDRPDYLETTILKATAFVRGVYSGGKRSASEDPPLVEAAPEEGRYHARDYLSVVSGFQIMQQVFDGYVFVHGVDKVLTRDGKLLGRAGFDQDHNGPRYSPFLDGKKVVSSAWDALRDSEHFRLPSVDGMCFRPERDERIVEDGRRRMVNMYRKPRLALVEGDPSKMLDHMRRMLPVGDDLELLLSYFAFCAQNPGVKVQWWPVLVGAKGAIKSTWTEIMMRALGSEYVHVVNSTQLVEGTSHFNGWIENKLFLGIDDIHGSHRREFLDGFKPTVTNKSIPIEGKGREQVTGDNRANGLFTANDTAGVPISGDERRYAPFFYAYMSVAELRSDGMDDRYFGDIYAWLTGTGAYAALGWDYGFNVMAHYLHTRPIASVFNDVAAPETSATLRAIAAGLGKGEQEVIEAIEEGMPGFCGGWVSSIKLDHLLDKARINIARNRRRDMMRSLGYDWHPALINGRVNNVVQPDNSKPRLYCKTGSIAWNNLTDPVQVAAAYSAAQSIGGGERTAAAFAS